MRCNSKEVQPAFKPSTQQREPAIDLGPDMVVMRFAQASRGPQFPDMPRIRLADAPEGLVSHTRQQVSRSPAFFGLGSFQRLLKPCLKVAGIVYHPGAGGAQSLPTRPLGGDRQQEITCFTCMRCSLKNKQGSCLCVCTHMLVVPSREQWCYSLEILVA